MPADATVDGRYLTSTDDLFLAGLRPDRDVAVADAPMIVHGTTTASSRYVGLATNPFSRGDAEREWALIGQAALWSNLTDEAWVERSATRCEGLVPSPPLALSEPREPSSADLQHPSPELGYGELERIAVQRL
ncbi:MAG TPA: hypothetical protein VJW23_10690, partial [Propionibacteriaceae bacterium]|nr:hypothetical protein [Propionibacteriaceae bacterium]